MVLIKSLSSVRFELTMPKDEEAAMEQLRRGSLSSEVERYVQWALRHVGGRAADNARWNILTGHNMKAIAPLSASLRHNPARRNSTLGPLYDTGKMQDGIRAEVTGHEMVLKVIGAHAHLAAIHEYGADFRVSPRTVGHFKHFLGYDSQITRWARFAEDTTVHIPARPFLGPAMEQAIKQMSADPRLDMAQQVFDLWTRTTRTGNTRSEYSSAQVYDSEGSPTGYFKWSAQSYNETIPEGGASYRGGEGA